LNRLLRNLAVYVFYLGIAVLITWPLVANLSTRLTGFPYGDGHEMARHIWWYNYALRTGDSIFYQPLLGYPDGMEGVLLWAHPQQFFPAWLFAFVLPLPTAANLAILLTMALNGWAMYWLALDRLKGLRAPALLAGVGFMAAPTFQGHLGGGHAGLMVGWPVPLYVWSLFRLRESGGWRWIALSVLFFVLSPGGHILQLIYVLLPITAVFALWLLIERNWRGLGRTILVGIIGCALLLVFVLPIARSTFNTPAYTNEGGFTRYSADLLSVVSPSFFHPVYSVLEYPRRVLGINLEEGVSYVGIVAGVLLIIGVWKFRAARWWLALALVAWVLSLGPLLKIFDQPLRLSIDQYETSIPLPWALLQNLPFFSLARTPGRFNFALALAVAMLAGYGAAFVWERLRRPQVSWGVTGVIIAAMLFDYQVYWPLPTIPAAIPQAVYDLAERDDVRAVFNIPWDNVVAAKDAMYLQTAHHKPMIAGHVTRSTPVSPAKLTILQDTLDVGLLDDAFVDVVIVHKAYISDEQYTAIGEKLAAEPFYEDDEIALFDVTEPETAPELHVITPPQTEMTNRFDSYLYAPDARWVDIAGTFGLSRSETSREIVLSLDRQPVYRWTITDDQPFRVPLPVSADTYHTISLAVQPPCPQQYSPLLECQLVNLDNLIIEQPSNDLITLRDIQFDRGVTLVSAALPAATQTNLDVRLLWHFDQPLTENDVRFVHVLDAEGSPIAQQDNTLGVQRAGEGWAEMVNISLPEDLPPGEYRVYAGWYTLPDVTRFGVLSEVEGARDGWALLGSFDVSRE
jgi:hypothetical protein